MKIILECETEKQFDELNQDVKEFGKDLKYNIDEEYWAITFENIDYFSHNQTSYEIREGMKFFNFYDEDFSWLTIK